MLHYYKITYFITIILCDYVQTIDLFGPNLIINQIISNYTHKSIFIIKFEKFDIFDI